MNQRNEIRIKSFVFILSLFGLIFFLLPASAQASIINSDNLIRLTNEERIKNSLWPLGFNDKLQTAATSKADDMVKLNYFDHNSPQGTTPWFWFQKAGYEYTFAGENLAIDFTEAENIIKAWLASPSHRANILNPNYTEIGLATKTGVVRDEETTVVVQLFGAPADPEAENQILSSATSPFKEISLINSAYIIPNYEKGDKSFNLFVYLNQPVAEVKAVYQKEAIQLSLREEKIYTGEISLASLEPGETVQFNFTAQGKEGETDSYHLSYLIPAPPENSLANDLGFIKKGLARIRYLPRPNLLLASITFYLLILITTLILAIRRRHHHTIPPHLKTFHQQMNHH